MGLGYPWKLFNLEYFPIYGKSYLSSPIQFCEIFVLWKIYSTLLTERSIRVLESWLYTYYISITCMQSGCVTLHCGIVLLYRFMQLQYSGVAMDSWHSGGHHSCWSISFGHVEMYHLLEGNVTNDYHCNYKEQLYYQIAENLVLSYYFSCWLVNLILNFILYFDANQCKTCVTVCYLYTLCCPSLGLLRIQRLPEDATITEMVAGKTDKS